MLYQLNNIRKEVSESYYYEQFYEMKHNISNISIIEFISSLFYSLRYFTIDAHLREEYQYLRKGLTASFSFLIWGYGERPGRILSFSFGILIIFSVIYYLSPLIKLNHDTINSFYLSIVTFTTLGFGDITPINNNYLKIIVGTEALIGAFCMGLLVAGYANKNKY
jgi:hypothetical protein